jgi:hypothetical protein
MGKTSADLSGNEHLRKENLAWPKKESASLPCVKSRESNG